MIVLKDVICHQITVDVGREVDLDQEAVVVTLDETTIGDLSGVEAEVDLQGDLIENMIGEKV